MEKLTKEEKRKELDRAHAMVTATLAYLQEACKDQPDMGSYFSSLSIQEEELYNRGQLGALKNWFVELTGWAEEVKDSDFWEYMHAKLGHTVINGFETKVEEEFMMY